MVRFSLHLYKRLNLRLSNLSLFESAAYDEPFGGIVELFPRICFLMDFARKTNCEKNISKHLLFEDTHHDDQNKLLKALTCLDHHLGKVR